MKVDYISDLHLDFHVKINSNEKKYKEATERFCESLLPKKLGEVLVIAGDISHYNRQSKMVLDYFSTLYEKVFYVLGNHDYYLVSGEQEKKYKHNSMSREMELFDMMTLNRKVVFLYDYMVHEHNGRTFAGDTNWYSLESIHEKSFFYYASNDSQLIKGLDIAQQSSMQMFEYDKLKEVDVLVTHVPSIQINSHVKYNSYYCYLNTLEPKAKHHIFGHCHEQAMYAKAGHNFYINALGYPDEWTQNMDYLAYQKEEREEFKAKWNTIKSFEI